MFDDKNAGVRRMVGDVFEIERNRFYEISKVLPGFIKKVESKEGKAEKC